MKKALISLFTAGLTAASFAAADDVVIMFSTPGPDTYADGGTVLDGECYALVWTKDGSSFAGITVSGEMADPVNNKLVLVAPCAANGRCPTVMFEINSAFAKSLEGGSYTVYLLDTRETDAAGNKTVAGVDSSTGKLTTVNGLGATSAAVSVKQNDKFKANVDSPATPSATGETIGAAAALPDKPQPKVKDVRVIGDKVYLTVEKIAGATIRVQSAATANPAAFTQDSGAPEVDNETSEDMVIARPATGSSGFYRVINK